MSDAAWALQTARQVGPVHPPHAHPHPIHKLHTGPLHSHVAGRTDHLPSNVPNGAYVLPADIVSALGEGNTMAGFRIAKRMFEGAGRHFEGTPYAGENGPYGQGTGLPYGHAKGGQITIGRNEKQTTVGPGYEEWQTQPSGGVPDPMNGVTGPTLDPGPSFQEQLEDNRNRQDIIDQHVGTPLADGGAIGGNVGTYQGSWNPGRAPKQYDKRYFDIAPDALKDDDGTVVATRQKAIPKVPIRDTLDMEADPNLMYRGMSHGEFENFRKTGQIKSAGSHNLGNQSGLTYWTTEPRTADTYSNSFAPRQHKPTWDKPAYVVAAKRVGPEDLRHVKGTGEHELGVTRPIGRHEVSAIYRGNVVHYDPGEGNAVAPSAWLNWEQTNPKEHFATGGSADQGVPVAVAGGEHVLAPHEVMFAGMGDLDAGHRCLDDFVKRIRAKTIKTLQTLPGPKRD